MQSSTDTNNNNISDTFSVSGGTNTQANTANNIDVTVMTTNTDQQHNNTPIRLLCSEFFLENYGQVIAQLVQGCFFFGREQQHGTTKTKSSIQFIDTNLMDTCGVDIETPSGGAIVVSTVSGIQKTGLSQFLERIMELTATTRYHQLEIFVCIDVELDDAATQDVVELQTALLCSRNATKTHTTFKLSSMCSLAHCIAQRIYYSSSTSTSTSTTSTATTTTTTVAGGTSACNYSHSSSSLLSKVEHWLTDQRACRRLQFLLSIIPTLSVTGALHWLDTSVLAMDEDHLLQQATTMDNNDEDEEDDKSMRWIQHCFDPLHHHHHAMNISPTVSMQLQMVATVQLNGYQF